VNTETAQMLLRCHRPGRNADGNIEKAVRVVEEDPELKKTFDEQVEFDTQIIDVIHFIKPPENLRQKLSDLGLKPRADGARLRRQVINPAVLTALLGVVVIAGIIVFFVIDRMEKFPGRELVENMLGAAGRMNPKELDPVSNTTGQLGDWFYMRGYDGYEAPPELAALPVVASRVFRVDGQTVAQSAIGNGDTANPGVRCLLFQFHASEFGVQLPAEQDWKVLTRDEWVGAIRQHGDHCFLVAFRGTKTDMQEFLKNLPPKK
jgi:hypothetical protein